MTRDFFDEPVAARYDEDSAEMFAPAVVEPVVDVLAALAGGGRALELGVGTGRIALPLAARGVPVHGVDLSEAMVARLRAKPGAEAVTTTIGDFATTPHEGTFALAYLVFNTISNLTTQDAQVECFANVARHLEPGGRFVIEVGMPEPDEPRRIFHWSDDRWGVDEYDRARQGMVSHHFWREGDHVRHAAIPFRYTWPAELDLMARLAGMRLEHRWADWDRSPFTRESRKHVSVWVV